MLPGEKGNIRFLFRKLKSMYAFCTHTYTDFYVFIYREEYEKNKG